MKKQLLSLFFITATGISLVIHSMETEINTQTMQEKFQQFKQKFLDLQKEYLEIYNYYKNKPSSMRQAYMNELIDNLAPNASALREKIYQYFIALPDTTKKNPIRKNLVSLLDDLKDWEQRISDSRD